MAQQTLNYCSENCTSCGYAIWDYRLIGRCMKYNFNLCVDSNKNVIVNGAEDFVSCISYFYSETNHNYFNQ